MRVLVLSLLLLAMAAPVRAELAFRRMVSEVRASSLAYDAALCALWVADEGPVLRLLSVDGGEILTIDSGLASVRSLTVERDGLIVTNGWGDFLRIDRQGHPRGARFALEGTLRDTEGLHRDQGGSFLVVEDDPARLMRIAPDGAMRMALSGDAFEPPMREPQGIARDPYSGNILVVDDNEGLNSLFELAPDGRVISVTPLSDWGVDAEGVALQPETGTLFVGFDGGRGIAVFDWRPGAISIDTALDRGPACALS